MLQAPGRGPRILVILLAGALFSCAGAPPDPAPGKGTLYGRISLIPHAGVTPGVAGTTVYTDRRLRDVEYVDYGAPGPSVVYLEGAGLPATGESSLVLARDAFGTARFDCDLVALNVGGRLALENRDTVPHTFSCPEAGLLRVLAPAARVSLPIPPGPLRLYVLDLPGTTAHVFAAPGPFQITTRTGAWELRDLDPGAFTLRVWHPRFPPASRDVTVAAGDLKRVDVTLRVEDAGRGDSR